MHPPPAFLLPFSDLALGTSCLDQLPYSQADQQVLAVGGKAPIWVTFGQLSEIKIIGGHRSRGDVSGISPGQSLLTSFWQETIDSILKQIYDILTKI